VDLGGRDVGEWQRAVLRSFDLVSETMPEIAEEMRLILRHVGPVGYFDREHLSASYVEATGVVYLSLHPNELTLAEALIHEFQHNKLNLLSSEDAVLVNADHPLFASPVRPDPRPLRGVLLAVHAFQPIVTMYERLVARGGERAEGLRTRLSEVARTCREGCAVLLPNAIPTDRGRPLLDEIAKYDRAFAVHLGEPSRGA
jgi:HEXXH motif-containing protein